MLQGKYIPMTYKYNINVEEENGYGDTQLEWDQKFF
jgi:hypothetical protein